VYAGVENVTTAVVALVHETPLRSAPRLEYGTAGFVLASMIV